MREGGGKGAGDWGEVVKGEVDSEEEAREEGDSGEGGLYDDRNDGPCSSWQQWQKRANPTIRRQVVWSV